MSERVEPRLRERYKKEIVPNLMKRFGYDNPMQVPKLRTIVVNMGLGEAVANPKLIEAAVAEVTAITGQKPVVTRAKKSIATFKLREGMPIGVKVTLRRERMWEFFDRLVNLALPRVRDFRGTSPKAFDGSGNYTLGLKEQIVFPEIDFDQVEKIKGMNITFVTTAGTDEEAKELLGSLGMPFRS
jgi:large subunit ribosomal protein L5